MCLLVVSEGISICFCCASCSMFMFYVCACHCILVLWSYHESLNTASFASLTMHVASLCPLADFVVRYHAAVTGKQRVQSSGRCRKKSGEFLCIVQVCVPNASLLHADFTDGKEAVVHLTLADGCHLLTHCATGYRGRQQCCSGGDADRH